MHQFKLLESRISDTHLELYILQHPPSTQLFRRRLPTHMQRVYSRFHAWEIQRVLDCIKARREMDVRLGALCGVVDVVDWVLASRLEGPAVVR